RPLRVGSPPVCSRGVIPPPARQVVRAGVDLSQCGRGLGFLESTIVTKNECLPTATEAGGMIVPNQAVGSTLLSEIYAPIAKPRDVAAIPANLSDYQHIRDTFGWDAARELLNGLPDGRGLNIAHEAVDRHAESPRADRDALRWIGRDGGRRSLTYRQLKAAPNQFANALRGLGAREGDVVFVMAGRILELYIAALGALTAKCVVSPLFSAFGPEPIATRVSIGAGRFLVTTNQLYRRKIAQSRARLRTLEHVIVVSEAGQNAVPLPGTLDWHRLVDTQSPDFVIPPTAPGDRALLHFTSGTTGRPKGAIHVHQAVVTHHVTGFYALDLHDDDIFWCTADPGWVTGTSYGIIAPLTNGVTSVVAEAEFDAPTWYGILQNERVSVWYTAPTAI